MPEQVMKRLAEEIKLLEHELTTELPAEIKKAVALGDLSENAEYHMAKQRQVFVNARLGQLKKRMGELAMVNLVEYSQRQGRVWRDGDGLRLEQGRGDQVPAGDERGVGRGEGADLDDVADRARAAGQEGGRYGDGGYAERQTRAGDSEAADDPRRRRDRLERTADVVSKRRRRSSFGGHVF